MKKIFTILFSLTLIFITIKSFTNANGPGGGYTNGPSEANCVSCHNQASLNAGAFRNNLTLNGNFTGGGYIPDSTYTITVAYNQPGISKFGFQTMVLDKGTSSPAGTLTAVGTRNQKRTKVVSGKTREYIEHTSAGTSATSTNNTFWTFEWKAPTNNVGDVIFYVVLNAANNNSAVNLDTIYAREFTISPSNLLPTADISASDDTVCVGEPVTFFGSGSGSPTSYTWNFQNGNPTTSNTQNQTVSYNFAGTFNAILQTRNSKGVSKPDTFKIRVNASPTAAIVGSSARKMCKGDSLLLTAQFSANSQYLWSNGKSGQNIYVNDTGTYHVAVTQTNGCSRISAPVTVSFHTQPTTTLSHSMNSDTLCSGDELILNATGTFDSFYYYQNKKYLGVSKTNQWKHNVDSTAKFQARVRDSNGCFSEFSNDVSIAVNQRLEIPATSCIDQTPTSVTFTWANNPFYHNGVEISLDSGKTWMQPNGGNKHVLTGLNQKTKYEAHVRALDNAPCMYSPTAIQVCETGACNSLNAQVKYAQAVCFGENVLVEVNGLAGQRYSLKIEGGASITDTIFEFQPTLSKKYLLEIIDSNFISCPSEKVELNIRVDKIGGVNLRTQSSANTFCSADTVELTATSGKDKYSFFVNNTMRIQTFDSFYYSNMFSDKDSVWVIVEEGACLDTSEKIILTVYPLPDADFTWQRDTAEKDKVVLKFSATNQGMESYLFTFGDGKTSVLSNTSNDYSGKEGQTLEISLWVRDFFGCENTLKKQVQIPFLNHTGNLSADHFIIYPNPADRYITIENKAGFEITEIFMTNIQGQEVRRLSNERETSSVNIAELPQGLYLLTVKTPNGSLQKVIAVQ